jgi:hypothetical protein
MAIAEEDGLIVDLVVGGIDRDEVRESGWRAVDTQRLDAVARFFRLMDQTADIEPPADLVESTLARIEAAGR